MDKPQVSSRASSRLGKRLVVLTILASGLIASLITAVQLLIEYQRDISAIEQRFQEIETAYVPSVRQSLWVMDQQALQVLAEGMQQLPDFAYAAMLVEERTVASSGRRPAGADFLQRYEIRYDYRGQSQLIGVLEVAASNQGPLKRTWQRLWLVLLLNLLKTAIVAAFVLALVRRMITTPLQQIHQHAAAMGAGNLAQPLQLATAYPSAADDEIHELAGAIDNMRVSLRARTAELHETNEQLREAVADREIALLQVKAHAEALELAAGVFVNTIEGIMITDARGTILSTNPAFTTLTGYSAPEALGKTPRLLRSERQHDNFYREMWALLDSTGEWRGELWNRRKNGEAYLQWTSITTIRDEHGRPYRRIAVMTDITESRRKDEHIRHQAYHDPLTGLPNRMLMQNRLEHALKGAERDGTRVAMLFIDLDRFKIINDSLGHSIGDELLIQVAQRLTGCVRASDTIARLGGDEFVVLAEVDHSTDAAHIAEKIINDIAPPFAINGHALHIGASIGISIYPQDGSDTGTLLRNADVAMYAAKQAGRGTLRFFDSGMNERAQKRLSLEAALRRALVQDEFELYYQTKVCLLDRRHCGMEALIRWNDPELGIISPLEFIPLAEEIGLIEAIGDWVLDMACAQMKQWSKLGQASGPVAVNVSARQLDNPAFADNIEHLLSRHQLDPALLQIEVTESTVMAKPEQAIAALSKLANLGISIAVDDFGTGYSSFSYLKRLPIHVLKIDRSFVKDIGCSAEDEKIVTAIVQVAHALKLQIVAEGVETESQAGFLGELGCQYAQGYLYAKPLPLGEFETLVSG